jgi:hypothetical protein
MLYRNPELNKRVFELLVIYFLRCKTVLLGLENVQVLESSKSKETLENVKKVSKDLNRYKSETTYWLPKNNVYGE